MLTCRQKKGSGNNFTSWLVGVGVGLGLDDPTAYDVLLGLRLDYVRTFRV